MAICVSCQNLTRSTNYCSYFNVVLGLRVLHLQMDCKGYVVRKLLESVAEDQELRGEIRAQVERRLFWLKTSEKKAKKKVAPEAAAS